jgi:hypothetical protein
VTTWGTKTRLDRLHPLTRAVSAASIMIVASLAAPALGQTNDSAYTDLDLSTCSSIARAGYDRSWICPGHGGFMVMIDERRGRYSASYGVDAFAERITTPVIVGDADRLGAKIEWRLVFRDGVWHPSAAILRRHFNEPPASQILVVTKVEPGNSCDIGFVDAGLIRDPNTVARNIADTIAADFACGDDEPMLAPS